MLIDDAYNFLRDEWGVMTHADFSTIYLGHSPRYYDYLRCSGADPSLKALLKLAFELIELHSPTGLDFDETEPGRLAQRVMGAALNYCR